MKGARHFFISDTHFSHANIIKYCNRPFANVKEMNDTMISNWNAVVAKDDIVFHLGDVILGDKSDAKDIVSSLNGIKFLVKGNHDTRHNQFYRDIGFEEVYDHPIIIKDTMILSHEPLPFAMNEMCYNVYGHVHDSPMFQTKGEHCACACVERWNYSPVLDKQLLDICLNDIKPRQPLTF